MGVKVSLKVDSGKVVQPLGNRVTVTTPEAPERIGLIWLPDESKETYTLCQAEVVAVGTGVRDRRIQPGLRVIVKRFGGFPHDERKTVWTVYEDHVLAVLDVDE